MKSPIKSAVNLMHETHFATLATHCVPMPRYPYATVVPNVLDGGHRPILFISELAEHTKNILADVRVSLMYARIDAKNVQTSARLSVIGDAQLFEPDSVLKQRYFRYQPDAEQYQELDFMFFRIHPKRIRYIAGIGRMGWIEGDDFASFPSLAEDAERALIEAVAKSVSSGIRLLGIDPFGIDYDTKGNSRRSGHVGAAEAVVIASIARAAGRFRVRWE
jgi:hypothetical protein